MLMAETRCEQVNMYKNEAQGKRADVVRLYKIDTGELLIERRGVMSHDQLFRTYERMQKHIGSKDE